MQRQFFSYQDKVVFEHVQLPSTFERFPKIFQEEEACFLYLDKGAFQFRTPTNLIALNEGEAIVAKCGNYYVEQIPRPGNFDTISVIGAYFYPDMVKDFFQIDLQLIEFQRSIDVSRALMEPLLKGYIESLRYLFKHRTLVDDNLIVNKLKELILLLGKSEASMHDYINALFTPVEYDFREIIHENTYANLSLAELAKLCGCSLATFKRRFQKSFGQSPARYLLQKKLEKSRQLLAVPSLPMTDIADACGFGQVNGFNKAFKRHFGQTPSQLRMSQKDRKLSL